MKDDVLIDGAGTDDGQVNIAWSERLESFTVRDSSPMARPYVRANIEMIEKALRGEGPDGPSADGGGARVVANISNVHIPSFCKTFYQNGYTLNKLRVGAAPENRTRRERLDVAISKVADCAQDKIYYAALELNGAGVRFYGDICLVLKDSKRVRLVLDRNSYDLLRSPLCAKSRRTSFSRLPTSPPRPSTILGGFASRSRRRVACARILRQRQRRCVTCCSRFWASR